MLRPPRCFRAVNSPKSINSASPARSIGRCHEVFAGRIMPELTVGGRTFSLRRASPEEIVDLRWRILRAGLPRAEAIFAGDELATSFHYLAAEHAINGADP